MDPIQKFIKEFSDRIEVATPASTKLLHGIEDEFGYKAAAIAGLLLLEVRVAELEITGGLKIGSNMATDLFPDIPTPVVNALATVVIGIENIPNIPNQVTNRLDHLNQKLRIELLAADDYANAADNYATNVVNQINAYNDSAGLLTTSEIIHNVSHPLSAAQSAWGRVESWWNG